tara:strand:+ start:2317 stop:2886 length:570 start_codon:yes stop_codon:yes gene_type:complete
MLWKKTNLSFIIILFNSSIIGLIFPDFDYFYIKSFFFKNFIGHRSIITHSILIPSLICLFVFRRKILNKNLVVILIGLFLGLALHLTADFFPKGNDEAEFIKLPGNISIGKYSQIWIALNSLFSLYIVRKLLNSYFKEEYYRIQFLVSSLVLTLFYIFFETNNQFLILFTFSTVLIAIFLYEKKFTKIK